MAEQAPEAVTLNTLHEDLRDGFAEMRADLREGFAEMRDGFAEMRADLREGFAEMRTGFADLKATLVVGFRSLPGRESADEMIRLLREGNRLQEERFTQLDVRIREQHLETQQVLHALVEGQRLLVEGQRSLSSDIKALIARLDALISGRGDGGSTA